MSRLTSPGIRRLAVLASILATSVLAPGMARHAARAADATTLTIGLAAEPDTLDPQATGLASTSDIVAYIGDTLVRLSPKNQLVPGLARSWSISKDGLTYSFTLRPDVT